MFCDLCYEVYDGSLIKSEFGFCPKAQCGGELHVVDELLMPAIIELNKKGYITNYCCSGHYYSDADEQTGRQHTYISFCAEECTPDFENLPAGFTVDDGGTVIRKWRSRLQGKNLFADILNTAQELYTWALELEAYPY